MSWKLKRVLSFTSEKFLLRIFVLGLSYSSFDQPKGRSLSWNSRLFDLENKWESHGTCECKSDINPVSYYVRGFRNSGDDCHEVQEISVRR